MGQSLTQLLLAYLPLIVFIGVAVVIGLALLIVAFVVAYKQPDPEKLSAYECGFNAFDDARMKFDVRFYLVAIMFLLFDVELLFLYPWAVAQWSSGTIPVIAGTAAPAAGIPAELRAWVLGEIVVFVGILAAAFAYAWRKGVFEWR